MTDKVYIKESFMELIYMNLIRLLMATNALNLKELPAIKIHLLLKRRRNLAPKKVDTGFPKRVKHVITTKISQKILL